MDSGAVGYAWIGSIWWKGAGGKLMVNEGYAIEQGEVELCVWIVVVMRRWL